MSATNRGRCRREHDDYPTPGWCVHRLFEALYFDTDIDYRWLEPCAGDGNLVHTINTIYQRIQWDVVEIRGECIGNLKVHLDCFRIADFLAKATKISKRYAVAITNPPFSFALDVVKKCRRYSDNTIILQRLNFLGSAKRAPFFAGDMPDVYVLPDRPCFTGDGRTDAEVYAWFHWGCQPKGTGNIEVLKTTPLAGRNDHASILAASRK